MSCRWGAEIGGSPPPRPWKAQCPEAFPGLEPEEAGSEGNGAPLVYGCEGFCSPSDWLQVCSGLRVSGEKATSLQRGGSVGEGQGALEARLRHAALHGRAISDLGRAPGWDSWCEGNDSVTAGEKQWVVTETPGTGHRWLWGPPSSVSSCDKGSGGPYIANLSKKSQTLGQNKTTTGPDGF